MGEEKKGFFRRLVSGLTKTRDNIVSGMDSIFHGFSKIDEDFYEELEEVLIMGDLGVQATYDILDDLKEEDLLECRNARRVLTETNDYPINDGVEVAVSQDGYTQYSREYEKKELRLSGVAVELEKEGTWKVIHHFRWNEDPGFWGTESLQIYPVYSGQKSGSFLLTGRAGAHGSDRVI